MGQLISKGRIHPAEQYRPNPLVIAPVVVSEMIGRQPCALCCNNEGSITLMCGHVYRLGCEKMHLWINDLTWCPMCRVSPINRGRVMNLIQRCAHADEGYEACHMYDSIITGIHNGIQLSRDMYNPLTETWNVAPPPELRNIL